MADLAGYVTADTLRTKFAAAMSALYREEVPLYGRLSDGVRAINAQHLAADPGLQAVLGEDLERLQLERHGAIRVGRADEFHWLGRLFQLMGMQPVAYYDLAAAGIPVHATAFRPVTEAGLHHSPFRLFSSLLRLDLIADADLRQRAQEILERRQIFSEPALAAIVQAEQAGGVTRARADHFIELMVATFRWQPLARVDQSTYQAMRAVHPLLADVVCFAGPHINHLTPRTLDIDAVQAWMPSAGMQAKAVIEGPPRRQMPLLLRQTSFMALQESIQFPTASGGADLGAHTARFGEVEQRGVALTAAGRARYDACLVRARGGETLEAAFADFPDDWASLWAEGLAYGRYRRPMATDSKPQHAAQLYAAVSTHAGEYEVVPMLYEDFLPVSAAGIFQSNLGTGSQASFQAGSARLAFEQALGRPVIDEQAWYQSCSQASLLASQQR